MNDLQRLWWISLLVLFSLCGAAARAAGDETWAPTPPRLSFIDGEVSYWRPGADEWARARPNLALAEGDALYAGNGARLEVQFGSGSFVRADENSQLSLVEQDARAIQFKLTGGRASFDLRKMASEAVVVSTPYAVFTLSRPGYYRVEVGSDDARFSIRRGGEATATAADGRTLSMGPSDDTVIAAGEPASLDTDAEPPPDDWDRWNDERSEQIGESVSARYLPPSVYGAEDLDRYGQWRTAPGYGPVWIPEGVSADWAPYSAGYWVWDPYYEWTWIDDAPWGWAPFHYGRWIAIGGSWAWTPGPPARRPAYSPALVAFMVRDRDASAPPGAGLPGVWWVALGWGEPVLPWWGPPRYRGLPQWGGWAGPRIVNNVVINQTTVIHAGDIHFHNAALPHAVRTVPAGAFGRERVHATADKRYRPADFAPVRGELPVKPTRASLIGGAPRGALPPRDMLSRPVVSTRMPRERAEPWQDKVPGTRAQAVPESRYVIPPVRRAEEARSLPPPVATEAGPARTPPPSPPRHDGENKPAPPPPLVPRSPASEPAKTMPPPPPPPPRQGEASHRAPPPPVAPRSLEIEREKALVQTPGREPAARRREDRPAARPDRPVIPPPAPAVRSAEPGAQSPPRPEAAPSPGGPSHPPAGPAPRSDGQGQDKKARPQPGQPANRGHDREDPGAR